MFDKIITTVVKNSLKNHRYNVSRSIVSICNKFNISINPDIFNNIQFDGKNAINGAILNGNSMAVRTFLNNGAKLNLDVSNSISCLNSAIISKNFDLLHVLLEHIQYRHALNKTAYDKNIVSLLTANDKTNKSPLFTACDLFLNSSNKVDKVFSKKCIELMYNSPLFNKNNSEFYNTQWKKNSNYFLEYDQHILNSIESYVLNSKNTELIKLFIDNGLIYVDKSILCVNPNLYSHSGIIIKFNKPIKFKDSTSDVAGILYSFELKDKTNNSKKTFVEKKAHLAEQISSFISKRNAYMKRILLTSKDMVNMQEHHGVGIFKLSKVLGTHVKEAVTAAFKTLDSLRKTPSFSNLKLTGLLQRLTSNIEDIAYLFSLYTKDANNLVAKDKIIKYNFDEGRPNITIGHNSECGYSIYDFIWKSPASLNLSYTQKLNVIEKFLNIECLKVLKGNKIIPKHCATFCIDNFDKLPNVQPNDLDAKFYYPRTITFDFNLDPSNKTKRNPVSTAMCGHKMTYLLEQFNINVESYSFFTNNCITTLKRTLSECGYKDQIEKADKTLNICQKRHPLSVIKRLQNMLNITREFVIRR